MATLAAPSYQTLYSSALPRPSSTRTSPEASWPSFQTPPSSPYQGHHAPVLQSRSRVLSSRGANQYPPGLGYDIGSRGRKTDRKPTSYVILPTSRSGSGGVVSAPVKSRFDPFSLDDPTIPSTYPYGDSDENKTPLVYSHSPARPYVIRIPPAPLHPPSPSRPIPSSRSASPVASKGSPVPEVRKSTPVLVKNPNARVIASILLNRIHAVGRPRRAGTAADRAGYVKSGLSKVVSVGS